MSRNVFKTYTPPNRNLISKELLDIIHELKMNRSLEIIKNEAEIFGWLFLRDGATISICPFLNILESTENIPVAEKDGRFICDLFLKHMKEIDPAKKK